MKNVFRNFAALLALVLMSQPVAAQMRMAANAQSTAVAGVEMRQGLPVEVGAVSFTYTITCIDKHGHVKWRESFHNLVTTAGKNDLLDKYFKGSSYTATWFLGLKGTGSAAAADTASSHAGWSEVTPYSGNRPAITFGTSSSGSNTATAVSYSINATQTVAGAFVQSVNTGTTGILYSAGDFAASRSVVSGDTLNVTLTVSV